MKFFNWGVYALLAEACAITSALFVESNGWRLLLNLLATLWAASAGIQLLKENVARQLKLRNRCQEALKKEGIEL